MRFRTLLLVAVAVFVVPVAVQARKHPRAACNVDDCTVVSALADQCDCTTADSHGSYVRCVAHAAKQLAADAVLPRYCRGKLVKAAAHSVCGQLDKVACVAPTSTCDQDGFCVNDPNVECVDDSDCGTACSTMTSDACDAANGIASDAPYCSVDYCFSPSGAFIDGIE